MKEVTSLSPLIWGSWQDLPELGRKRLARVGEELPPVISNPEEGISQQETARANNCKAFTYLSYFVIELLCWWKA